MPPGSLYVPPQAYIVSLLILISDTTLIYAVFVSSSKPKGFVATNVTVYSPGSLYVTVGFCSVEVAGVPPSKVHDHDVGILVERSVNVTELPKGTIVSDAEKSAVGAMPSYIVMCPVVEDVHPFGFSIVSVTS